MPNISKTSADKKLLKLPTRISSFEDVQKAFRDLELFANTLLKAVNTEGEKEVTDKDGKTGDVRITRNADKTYKMEVKSEEGWQFGQVGGAQVRYVAKAPEFSKKDKSKDDMNLPRPDYDSGLLTLSNPITVTHNLGVHPTMIQLFFTHDDGTTFHYIVTTSNNNTMIESTTTTTIIRKAGTSWGWYYDSSQVDIDDGDGKFKLLLWK